MLFYITVSSKDKTTLKNFLIFFSVIKLPHLQFLKLRKKKQNTKIVTVLRSPHINKTAQEQFEFRFFNRQISFLSANPLLSLNIFKRIIKKRFPGIKLKLICIFDKKKQNKIRLSFLNPDKVVFKKKFSPTYLKMFDFYGEAYLKTKLQS